MPVDRNKKSIGEAYLQFATLSDADKAMTKHKDKIGYRLGPNIVQNNTNTICFYFYFIF